MHLSKLKFPVGRRTVKTAAAVMIAMLIVDAYGATTSKLIFAMLGAMEAVQPTFKDSLRSCVSQVVGVFLGALVGVALMALPINHVLAAGLGIEGPVTSPTYTIVNEYLTGRLPLFHFDMYRLGSSDELFDIGWEDYLARGGVCAVEWSENVDDALIDPICIHISHWGENCRKITIGGGRSLAPVSL